MRHYLHFTLFILLIHSYLCESQVLEETDTGNFRATIYEEASKVYIKAVNLETGHAFGPTQIYSGLDSNAIKNSLSGNIAIQNVSDTSLSVLPPLYATPVQLTSTFQTNITRQLNLIKLQIGDLVKENDALKEENKALANK